MNIKPKDKSRTYDKRAKTPRKITQTYLYNSGLFYLQRYTSSKNNFIAVMTRKAKRSCAFHKDQNLEECIKMIEALADQFEESRMLDDAAYTKGMINSLRRSGKSKRAILMRLASKGLDKDLVEEALNLYDTEDHENCTDAERKAAMTHARKKRLGPFRTKPVEDEQKTYQRELASLARAGFSYETSRFALENKQNEE